MKNRWKYSFVKRKQVHTVYRAITPSGKSYIGYTSRKLRYRIKEHFYEAKKGTSGAFYGAIRKYGESNIIFEIVNIYFNQKLALKMEMKFIKKYKSLATENGYNIEHKEIGVSGRIYTKESRDDQSQRSKKMWKDNRVSMMNTFKESNKNNRFTKEALEKSLKVNRKKVIDSNNKIHESLVACGRYYDLSEANMRSYIKNGYSLNKTKFTYYNDGNFFFKIRYTNKVKCIDTGVVYESAAEAAREMKLNSSLSISRVCRNERNSYSGYNFDYIKGVI